MILFILDTTLKMVIVINDNKLYRAVDVGSAIDMCVIDEDRFVVCGPEGMKIMTMYGDGRVGEKILSVNGTPLVLTRVECIKRTGEAFILGLTSDRMGIYKIPL